MKKLLLIVPLVALMLLGAGNAYAWSTNGRVSCGDDLNNVLTGVSVTVTGKNCDDSNFVGTTETGSDGRYSVALPECPGIFEVKIGPKGLPCDVTSISPENPTTVDTTTNHWPWVEWRILSPDCSCKLLVEKSCSSPPPTPPSGEKCERPISQFSMIFTDHYKDGQIKPTDAPALSTNPSQIWVEREDGVIEGPITKGGPAHTFNYPLSLANDVEYFLCADALCTNILGTSTFHVSCSDINMDSPDDCGKLEGDGKLKTGFRNDWLLAGYVAKDGEVTCGADPPTPPTDPCTVTRLQLGACPTKPTALVFKYTGASCASYTQNQSGKWTCSQTGNLSGDLASLVMTKDASKFKVTIMGNQVVIAYNDPPGKEFPADIKFKITDENTQTQTQSLHTSCSQLLRVGDVFGSLTLTGFIPKGGSAAPNVVYTYKIDGSPSEWPLKSIEDNKLGSIPIPSTCTGLPCTITQPAILIGPFPVINEVTVTGDSGAEATDTATANAP